MESQVLMNRLPEARRSWYFAGRGRNATVSFELTPRPQWFLHSTVPGGYLARPAACQLRLCALRSDISRRICRVKYAI